MFSIQPRREASTLKRTHIAFAVVAVVILLSSTYFFVANYVFVNQPKEALRIHCATSLLYPLAKVEEDFENAYPNVDVQIEGHGTIQVIRHVTELGQNNDLMFVADYGLIPVMMYETKMLDSNQSYTDYYIRFATNRLVLAYTDQSRYADEINADNWYSILVRPEVTLGLGNPQVASIGYRAITAIQLAENYYEAPHLFHDLISANLNPPITSVSDGDTYTVTVPEVQNPKGEKLKLRTSEVELTALLDSGHLDYCLIYLSNALQYGFNYIELPDEVNMGSLQHQSIYEQVEVIYKHQRFATISLDRAGETIYYGVTIPKNAPHPDTAEKFLKFMLEGTGKNDFELAHHPVFSPSFTDNPAAVPESLKPLVVEEP
jgi:molybdate/tungstate transport system substrate-binding protein